MVIINWFSECFQSLSNERKLLLNSNRTKEQQHVKNFRHILVYLVGPYYAGPKSTPAHFTPALNPPRANFDLPPFRAAFNATIGKNQKNQKKGKVFNLQ